MPNSVLILGAGINGAALARELALNGVDVVIVERRDIACGATAYSSRLIHGGLRYLEYGEFALVRESLGERTRLLTLAPHFVHPLRLFIPVHHRFGGLMAAARRFFGLKDRPSKKPLHRGLWTVRLGLWLYDHYARDPTLPKRKSHCTTESGIVPIDPAKYPWTCEFSDAQVVFPERFTLALLEDARQLAAKQGSRFSIHTYSEAAWDGRTATIRQSATHEALETIEPSAVVNATGAWVDRTLQSLGMIQNRLLGGTKGSHFITGHARLQALLDGRAVYTEATDGRPVFILPFVKGTLVGTTDVPFDGDPETAVATPQELDYLIAAVNEVFPNLGLTTADIELHYAGVRPLPFTDAKTTAAITRRHWMEEHRGSPVPCFSIIGGKLTTCRSLAEEAANTILERLHLPHTANSRQRPLPGGENYPADEEALHWSWQQLAARCQLPVESVEAVWKLCGTRAIAILTQLCGRSSNAGVSLREAQPVAEGESRHSHPLLAGTSLPIVYSRWLIDHEWVTTLGDFVERRLMLLYQPSLRRECLEQLADLLIEAGKLSVTEKQSAINAVVRRLQTHFGKRVVA
ncbi:MAG: glycerol-3-phosphate dehydrogenase/oxidase [Pirellulales bacterium]|nr:glycerol-3-phosphate dehydrogenase/oxidase [Pirellulales bacterium]